MDIKIYKKHLSLVSPMIFRKLYDGFLDIDTRVLKFYRRYAEKWEARGHSSYGLPLFVTFHASGAAFNLDLVDDILNINGFVLTTKEPENSITQDWFHYGDKRKSGKISPIEYYELFLCRTYVAITTPLRIILKRTLYFDTPMTSDGLLGEVVEADPIIRGLQAVNRNIRLPMLVAGLGFLAKGLYGAGYSLATSEPINSVETGLDFSVALGFLKTSSSAYFKDGTDPKLGKKQKSLRQLAGEAWESLQEKISIEISEPVPANGKRDLEDILA